MNFQEQLPNGSPPPKKKSPEPLTLGGWLAWAAILTVTVGMFTLTAVSKSLSLGEESNEASATDLMAIEMQGKMLVGQQGLTNFAGSPSSLTNDKKNDEDEEDAKERQDLTDSLLPPQLDVGPYEQRLCYTILLNELNGPVQAKEHMELTDQRVKDADFALTEGQKNLRTAIEKLLNDYADGDKDGSGLAEESRSLIQDRLGWIGELALLPAGTSDVQGRARIVGQGTQALFVMMGGVFIGIAMLLAGFFMLALFFILTGLGKLNGQYRNRTGCHNIYLETFAIWLVAFFGMQLAVPLLMALLGFNNPMTALGIMPLVFFGSLTVLIWPSLRGIPMSQVREDIGWKLGNPFVETGLGGLAYMAILPGLAVALAAVMILMGILTAPQSAEVFAKGSGPSHPIQEYLAEGGLPLALLVALTAGVAAPIVEETMFRGVLYRHLRDWTAYRGRGISVIFSALLNSLIFAAIHPQGLFGIPMLMTLAIGFSLAREWRNSLLAPMVMHGINNLLVTSFLFLLL